MLNKDICFRCIKLFYGQNEIPLMYVDESRWNNGKVWCPSELILGKSSFKELSINDNPPNNCPYDLEHIISTESKINAK